MNTKVEERGSEPAYPGEVDVWVEEVRPMMHGGKFVRRAKSGLTIREHFAGLAMQGIRAATNPHTECALVAEMAVKQADALIAALNQGEGK